MGPIERSRGYISQKQTTVAGNFQVKVLQSHRETNAHVKPNKTPIVKKPKSLKPCLERLSACLLVILNGA